MESLFTLSYLNLKKFTLMTGFVVQGHMYAHFLHT